MYLTHDSTFVSLYFFLNDGNEVIKRRFDRKRAYIKTQSTREKFLYKLDPTDTRLPILTTSRQNLLISSFSDFIGR